MGMNNSKCKFLVTMLAGLIITAIAYSQPPTGDDDDDDVADVVELVPLDGGLSILLGAAIALGAKKAYQYSKERKNNMD